MESSGHAFGVPEDNAAQSGTGGAVYQAAPDYASLHPGYGAALRQPDAGAREDYRGAKI